MLKTCRRFAWLTSGLGEWVYTVLSAYSSERLFGPLEKDAVFQLQDAIAKRDDAQIVRTTRIVEP